MSMSSFYGGRQGASFIIVKQFDGLDIPQISGSYVYRKKICAIQIINNREYFIYPWIEQTADNYDNYNWGILELNGQTKDVVQNGSVTTKTADRVLAEGMRQCFEQGGDTTNVVNYGEYVIIDTLFGLHEVNNPDNGKVFRRGINFDYSATDNPYAGGEYIGQIVGPMGLSPKLYMNTVQEVIDEGGIVREYTPQEGDSQSGIVPGRYLENGVYKYNDNISYGWYSYYDVSGSRSNALIGFTFPYLVEEFTGTKRSPYYQAGDTIPAGKHVGDLLADNFSLITRTDDASHPYFQQWHIDLPHGIKGDSPNQLEVYSTYVKEGATIYEDSTLSVVHGTATGNEKVDVNLYDNANGYMRLENGYYASIFDGWRQRIRYKNYVYDETEDGSFTYIDIGEYNMIDKITLSPEGVITAYYTYDNAAILTPTDDTKLKWIYYDPSSASSRQGVYIDELGTLTIVYNALDENQSHEKQEFEEALSWIRSVSLSASGHFKVVYNNNSSEIQDATGTETRGGVTRKIYEATLTTVTDVRVNTDRYINDQGQEVVGDEGDGTQKVEVEYNSTGEYTEIGRPINYVIDSIVVPSSSPEVELRGHLLVYFSDPVRRGNSSIVNLSFVSPVLGKAVTGWTDIGLVKGEKGGICIFSVYNTMNDIPNLPPEIIMGDGVSVPDYNYAGWDALVGDTTNPNTDYHLAVYDYDAGQWNDIGVFIQSSVNPNRFITTSYTDPELQTDGFVIDITTRRKAVVR